MLSGNFADMTTSTPFRDLLHAANLRHGTDGFTSPPKEGVLRIFSPLKIEKCTVKQWNKMAILSIDHHNALPCSARIPLSVYKKSMPRRQGSLHAQSKSSFTAHCALTGHISSIPPRDINYSCFFCATGKWPFGSIRWTHPEKKTLLILILRPQWGFE